MGLKHNNGEEKRHRNNHPFVADRAFGRPETDRLPRFELGLGLCADMDSVCRRHHRIFRGGHILFNPKTQEAMNGLEIFNILTRRGVFIRVSNLKIDGLDESGQPIYTPQVKITIGKNGVELATFIGESLETELNNAYDWAIENKVVSDAPMYLPQCETCMRKIAGEVLDVCKDASSPYRNQDWHNTSKCDCCLYKIFGDSYPESYWATCLTPEQLSFAKSLNSKKNEK